MGHEAHRLALDDKTVPDLPRLVPEAVPGRGDGNQVRRRRGRLAAAVQDPVEIGHARQEALQALPGAPQGFRLSPPDLLLDATQALRALPGPLCLPARERGDPVPAHGTPRRTRR